MNLFNLLDVSGSALLAERQRAEVVATNLANAETTRTPGGGPYQRQEVVFGTAHVTRPSFGDAFDSAADNAVRGVEVVKVVTDPTPPIRRYDPSNPDANAQGYVEYPSINPAEETVDMLEAARAYQLNVDAVEATKGMITQALTILS
ncbi:MAG: flagellar basal body rod protein FlgC [Acidobacteriota bacterium]|nr:flagellar basal body rod protein FlgC [Acidobacteriota bacterium]